MRGKELLECMEYISDELVEEAMTDTAPTARRNYQWKKWGAAAACAAVLCISFVRFQTHSDRNYEKIGDIAGGQEEERTGADTAMPQSAERAAAEDVNADISNDEGSAITGGTAPASGTGELSEAIKDRTNVLNNELSEYTIIDTFPPKRPYREKNTDSIADEQTMSVQSYRVPEKGESFCHQPLINAMEYYDRTDGTTEAADAPRVAYQVVIDVFGDRTENGDILYEDLSLSDSGRALLGEEYHRLIAAGYHVSLSEDFRLTGILTKQELDGFEVAPEYGYIFRFEEE